jgi:hypothetical protein
MSSTVHYSAFAGIFHYPGVFLSFVLQHVAGAAAAAVFGNSCKDSDDIPLLPTSRLTNCVSVFLVDD